MKPAKQRNATEVRVSTSADRLSSVKHYQKPLKFDKICVMHLVYLEVCTGAMLLKIYCTKTFFFNGP
jgi:hypothetical protein